MTTMHAEETYLEAVAKIEGLLAAANGRRRERTIRLDEVLGLVRDLGDGPRKWAYCSGGGVAASYTYRAVTTFALAAEIDGRYYLGVRVVDAKSTTPGRAFTALQPWRAAKDWPEATPEGPAGDAAAKWAAWTTAPGVVELTAPEVDAIKDRP